ncbi:pilin [Frankia sp. CiP3]|uniref:pilin n=1 Tax=Frankia sp. CiP3 TaxID=2880971 RepID=UPI001EF54AF0|nr:pilin [Frankia sp. CiP3]
MLTRRSRPPGPTPAGPPHATGTSHSPAVLIRRVWQEIAAWKEIAGGVGTVLILVGTAVAARQGLAAGAGGPSTGRLLTLTVVAGLVGLLTAEAFGAPGTHRFADAGPTRRAGGRRALWVTVTVVLMLMLMLMLVLAAGAAWAGPLHLAQEAPPPPAPTPTSPDLDTVLKNLRNWLIGLCAGIATLFFTLGGLRYLGANGDPGEVERAKQAFKNAAVGYGLAILAPLFLKALRSVVGA